MTHFSAKYSVDHMAHSKSFRSSYTAEQALQLLLTNDTNSEEESDIEDAEDEDYGSEAVKAADNSDVNEKVDDNCSDEEGDIEILMENDPSESEDDEVLIKECHSFYVYTYMCRYL